MNATAAARNSLYSLRRFSDKLTREQRIVAGGIAALFLIVIATAGISVVTHKLPWQWFGGSGGPQNSVALHTGSTPTPTSGASPGSDTHDNIHHPVPKPTTLPTALPTPWDVIIGKAEIIGSDCVGGYEPGTTCHIYYHGRYYLQTQAAGKVYIKATIDGNVADSHTYPAPHGGKQFGTELVFKVPDHAKEIDYQAFLEDLTGKILAQTELQKTHGYG